MSKSAAAAKKKPQRSGSNVFAAFDQQQIQEFKEAFSIIDQDKDGFISEKDLSDMWASLGLREDCKKMMEGAQPEGYGFTPFLTMMGEKLQDTDPEDVLTNAFACFDVTGSGYIKKDDFKACLMQMGDRFTDAEIKQTFEVAPMKDDSVDWKRFIKLIKYGGDFEEES